MFLKEIQPVVSNHDKEIILTYLKTKKPFFIEGGPGIGKSLAVSYYGKQVYRKFYEDLNMEKTQNEEDEPWYEPLKIDITEDTEVRHLLGELDLIKYFSHVQSRPSEVKPIEDFFVPGPVTNAVSEGRLLIVEELDRAGRETLFPVFFDVIEYRRVYVPELGRHFEAGDNPFNIVITVNRFSDIGTVSLPKALLRRPRCIRFYDPSNESGINRWHAVQFETNIVMANVHRVLDRKALSHSLAERFIEDFLSEVIYPLRAGGEMDEVPTPAEVAMWFLDMFECEGDQLLGEQVPAEKRLEICLKFRGAMVKASNDDPKFVEALSAHFLQNSRI